ncbi:MAG: hypothetical protein JXB07_09390 [Anaerolineae bacterium]|nr:hypothetical protein [Anaerolineae bacterium]
MDTFTRDDLNDLLKHHSTTCLSVFMPFWMDAQAASIQLRNLLREAEQDLLARGMRIPDTKTFLKPVEDLLPDSSFWRVQGMGLAIFRAPDFFQSYRLQHDFTEHVSIGTRFHIKPLLPLMSGDGRFYVLALSQNAVRLMKGTRQNITEIDINHIPTSLNEALKEEVIEKQVQFRKGTGRLGSGGRGATSSQGYGGGAEEEDKERILRYFRQIDKGLQEMLRNERIPLVLAGVDYLHPLYQQVNTYPHLIEGGVTGSPDALKPAELHERAWASVQSIFLQEQQKAIAHYQQLANAERASADIAEIVPAAYYGRIETLLLDCSKAQWGKFDPESGSVTFHQSSQHGNDDLIDLAAAHTLLNSGDVYALGAESMPGQVAMAANFRY